MTCQYKRKDCPTVGCPEHAILIPREDSALVDQLRRALVRMEWYDGHDYENGGAPELWCPACEAEPGNGLPQDQKHGSSYAAMMAPENRCYLDMALTAAGLPDQASRDALRMQIAKEKADAVCTCVWADYLNNPSHKPECPRAMP